MKNISIIYLLLIFNICFANNESLKIEDLQYDHYFLNNGMEVFLLKSNNMNQIFHSISYMMDSQCEFTASEILRRMMFRSINNHQKNFYIETLENLGIEYNSFTKPSYTMYYSLLNNEDDLATVMQLELERMKNLAFFSEEFKLEKQILINDINNNNSDLFYNVDRKVMPLLFNDLSHNLFLKTDLANSIDIYHLKQIYEKYYQNCNAKLMIMGNFNIVQTKILIKNLYESKEKEIKCDNIAKNNINYHDNYGTILTKKNTQIGYDSILRFYSIDNTNQCVKNYFAWQILTIILSRNIDFSSTIDHNLVSSINNLGYLKIYANPDTALDIFSDSLTQNFLDIVNKIDEKILIQAKQFLIKEYLYKMDNFLSYALLQIFFINNNIDLKYFNDIQDVINKITVNNLTEILRYINNNEFIEVYLYNE